MTAPAECPMKLSFPVLLLLGCSSCGHLQLTTAPNTRERVIVHRTQHEFRYKRDAVIKLLVIAHTAGCLLASSCCATSGHSLSSCHYIAGVVSSQQLCSSWPCAPNLPGLHELADLLGQVVPHLLQRCVGVLLVALSSHKHCLWC